jgi:hypothetical protein
MGLNDIIYIMPEYTIDSYIKKYPDQNDQLEY